MKVFSNRTVLVQEQDYVDKFLVVESFVRISPLSFSFVSSSVNAKSTAFKTISSKSVDLSPYASCTVLRIRRYQRVSKKEPAVWFIGNSAALKCGTYLIQTLALRSCQKHLDHRYKCIVGDCLPTNFLAEGVASPRQLGFHQSSSLQVLLS